MNVMTQRWFRDLRSLAQEHRGKLPYAVGGLACLVIFVFSHSRESAVTIYKSERSPDFKDARVLGSQGDSIYEGKEKLLSKTFRDLMTAQTELREANEKLRIKVEDLEKGKGTAVSGGSDALPSSPPSPSQSPVSEAQAPEMATAAHSSPATTEVRVGPSPEALSVTHGGTGFGRPTALSTGNRGRGYPRTSSDHHGNEIISFPVKEVIVEKTESIAVPAGSYVKAKLMTGVEAPEGKTFPVLLQLDYAYIVPNQHKLDLSGCFMIAKSQGDLSTERVQMQATKLSCVSKEGRMFEREVNGFIADDKDNSFAVMGSVNSKQDRVAAMAFLSSIVEGVGKAIQQAQTTQQTNPLGGSQSVITGNQAEYLAAGGAASAASMVTQWYLKQAQNLLPTINVGSGRDVWVVMQDSVRLPNDYFRKNLKGSANESVYTYFSRILE